MYALFVSVSLKKDLTIFMKMGTIGTCCVCVLILYIIYQFFSSLAEGGFEFKPTESDDDVSSSVITIILFGAGYGNLMGILCTGFFIHQCSLPLVQAAAEPEKTGRNVFLGYVAVFCTYLIVGIGGYIGFTGKDYQETLQDDKFKG